MSDDIDVKQVLDAVEGLNKTWEEQKSVLDEQGKEIEKFGTALPETDAKLAKIEAEMDRLQKTADEAVLSAKRRESIRTDADGNEIDLDAKALRWAKSIRLDRSIDAYTAEDMAQYKAAFNSYIRQDERQLDASEVKALSVGSDPDGGYTVHPDMSGRVATKVFETSPMRAYASIQSISTDALEGLYDDDEAAVGWVGETSSRPSTDTPEIGRWRIPVHELYANPAATQKILDDSEINMEDWLSMKVADRFAREESAQFVTGDGVNKPRGFLDYPNGTSLRDSIERFNTGVNGAFAAAPDGGDVLIDALYGLKAQYRANATWFMNRATTKLTRKLKDSDGAYLWSPGIAAGQPATLLGYPVAAFEDMPDPATGSLSIAVGDMRTTYQIVDRVGIRVLRDPYTNKPYVHFYTTKRVGGDVVNGESLKLVEFSA